MNTYLRSIEIYYLQTKFAVPSVDWRVLDWMGAFAILAADAKVLGCVFETLPMVFNLCGYVNAVRNKVCNK